LRPGHHWVTTAQLNETDFADGVSDEIHGLVI
jgi:hypothetical protein